MFRLNKEYGFRFFFGADDNFFNDKSRTLDIVEKLARAEFDGVKLRDRARWYTEVTVHDTLQMKEHLPLVRESGCRALWLGVEDLTATLVKKGQSVDKTTEAFRALRDAGICPMPMMMHHDSQPLYSHGSNYGLLNQVGTPAPGRRRLVAGADDHPCRGFQAARVDLCERPGLQEGRRQGGASVHVRRQLRRRITPQASLAKAADDARGISVFLQSGLARGRADPQQDAGCQEARLSADLRQ